jgi:hypothetical protein
LPALDELADVPNTQCVAGCYRCLLSYYNQPDHPVIDRRDRTARHLLLRLAAVKTVVPQPPSDTPSMATATDSQPRIGESAGAAFDAVAHGLPAPDRGNFDYEGTAVLALWRAQRVALLAEGASNTALADKGLTCISWLPIQEQQGAVISLLRQHLA